MALQSYGYFTGQTQGYIKGSVTQKGREDTIGILAVNHEIVSPRDPGSGLPTGKRQHKPLVFVKETDKSTPLLYNVLTNNENLTEVIIRFWAPQHDAGRGGGQEVQFYTIRLVNATIASIHFRMYNVRDHEMSKRKEAEEIALAYQRIEWTFEDGGITAEDDWETPVS